MNKYKEKLIREKETLEMTLKQGNQIEKETNGQKPDWKAVYETRQKLKILEK